MSPRTLALAFVALLVAGCVQRAPLPPLADDDPANPNAPESPPHVRSRTLAPDDTTAPAGRGGRP